MPSTGRVLYVDESKNGREMLSALLGSGRIEARTVATASEALSLIQTERFDLYLLEASSRDLDGIELCRRLRACDARTPILCFAGATLEADKRRVIEAGANAYLDKPDVSELVSRIRWFVSQSQPATAKIIPFKLRRDDASSFTFGPAAA
jgi:DNA-binding response OmpR family regulator